MRRCAPWARFGMVTAALAWAMPATAQPIVVVTVKPVHSLVAGVTGTTNAPKLLLPTGTTPHAFSIRPSQARLLSRADVIVRVGPALEGFLDRALATLARRARIVTLMRDAGLTLIRHGRNDDDGQGLRDVDPHVWLDPENARRIVRRVAAVLGEIHPDGRARYAANARTVLARLDRLDGALAATLAPVRTVPYIVFHDAYRYFEARYGLSRAAAVTIAPQRAPGARHLAAVRRIIHGAGARCVFAEPQFRPALLRALIRGTEVRMGVLDPLGADIPPGPDAYFTLMRRLAASFRDCLAAR